ncbi:MAG: hypothetical protein C5B43_04915, partial [Verrucomicrobia bacterium]
LNFVAHAADSASAVAIKSPEPSAQDKKNIEAYGWIMGKQVVEGSSGQLGFNETERAILVQGIIKGAKGEGASPIGSKEEGDALEQYLESRAEKQQKETEVEVTKQLEAGKKAAKEFFEKLEKEKKAKKTASGLYYEIIKEGTKEMPKADSNVKIEYVGTLIDGTEFDSSKVRGQPATFNLAQVIPGFKEGLQLIGKGGKIRLYVPSDLAYGDNPLPRIPAGSTLIFDVDMLDITTDTTNPMAIKN